MASGIILIFPVTPEQINKYYCQCKFYIKGTIKRRKISRNEFVTSISDDISLVKPKNKHKLTKQNS